MTDKQFVKIIIPYFYDQPIEIYIKNELIPTDIEMIRFKALNCLASEKERDEIIRDMKYFLSLTGIEPINTDSEIVQNKAIEFPILL